MEETAAAAAAERSIRTVDVTEMKPVHRRCNFGARGGGGGGESGEGGDKTATGNQTVVGGGGILEIKLAGTVRGKRTRDLLLRVFFFFSLLF